MKPLSQTEKTLLELLSLGLAGKKANSLPPDLDWQALTQLATQHKILPLILSAVPSAPMTVKRMVFQQITAQNMRTTAFLELYEAMEATGLHPLVVKGILCRELYPQGDLRPSSDEDVYVTDGEFAACCEFLRHFGMTPTNSEEPDAWEIGWRKTGSPLYIELHRRLFAPDSAAYHDLGQFFDLEHLETTAYPITPGTRITSLKPHDHLLYLLLHAYKHFLHSGFGIRQVCDIGLWAARYDAQIHWPRLWEQCQVRNAHRFAAAVFGIARHVLQIPLELEGAWNGSPALWEPLLADVMAGGVYGSATEDRVHSATVTLNAVAANRIGRRSSIWRSVFPKRAALEGAYPYLKKYPLLLPFAWLQRLSRYLSKKPNTGQSITIAKERIELMKLYEIIQ